MKTSEILILGGLGFLAYKLLNKQPTRTNGTQVRGRGQVGATSGTVGEFEKVGADLWAAAKSIFGSPAQANADSASVYDPGGTAGYIVQGDANDNASAFTVVDDGYTDDGVTYEDGTDVVGSDWLTA